jgi:hypothetical protein
MVSLNEASPEQIAAFIKKYEDKSIQSPAISDSPIPSGTEEELGFMGQGAAIEEDTDSWFYKNILKPISEGYTTKTEAEAKAGKLLGRVASETAQLPITLGEGILTVTENQETINAIEKSNIGKAYASAIEAITPENLTQDEQIAANLISYLTAVGLGRKLFKEGVEVIINKFGKNKGRKLAIEMNKQLGGKPLGITHIIQQTVPKVAGTIGATTAFTTMDIQHRKEDEQIIENLKALGDKNWPETTQWISENLGIGELIEKLNIKPEDADDTALLKQYADSLLVQTGFVVPLYVLALAAKGGVGFTRLLKSKKNQKEAVNQAIKDGGANIPPPSKDKVVTSSTLEVSPTGEVKKRWWITEKIGNLNTSLGRELTSSRSMPPELVNISIKRTNAEKEFNLLIKADLKKIKKIQKKNNISNEDFKLYINQGQNNNLPEVFTKEVNAINAKIAANESRIFDMLGITKKGGKIGVRTDGQKFYYTRQFEAVFNPSWYKKVKKGLEELKIKGHNDNDFLKMLWEAKNYFRSQGVPEKEIEGTIRLLVQNMRNQDKDLMNNIFGTTPKFGELTALQTKVLKERQLKEPKIRALLGEITEPTKKLESTLVAQNKLLSELNWLREIHEYGLANIGKDIKLRGLFPFLPSARSTFQIGKGTDSRTIDLYELETIAKKTIGMFGDTPSTSKFLNNMYTSNTMGKYINDGLNLYSPQYAGGNAVRDTIAKISSLAQAKETLTDPFAYVLNTSGAINALVGNGHAFNPKNYLRAGSEAKTMIQQILKNDPKSVEKLGMLKRLGVIDQDVTGEMMAANAKLYGNDIRKLGMRTFSKTMEKLGRAYGQPDMYSKLIAFESEAASLRWIYPKKTWNGTTKEYDTFINERAAEIVRKTMPTYGVSVPIARRLARYPYLGNYVLFPTEIVRTTKGILFQGSRDLKEGIWKGNFRQAAVGVRRLAGLGATTYGVDQIFGINNDSKGINDNHKKAMQLLAAEWGKGSKNWYVESFVKDLTIRDKITKASIRKQFPKKNWENIRKQFNKKKDGYEKFIKERYTFQRDNVKPYLRTRTVNSMSADAIDYLKSTHKLVTAKLFGDDEMSEQEIENSAASALKAAITPYTTPKFLAAALVNAYTGVDSQTRRRLYDEATGASFKDNLLNFASIVGGGFKGGFWKATLDYINATNAEKLLGEGNAMRASGWPVNPEDIKLWAMVGALPRTRNIEKEIGYNLAGNMLEIDNLNKNFKKELREIKYSLKTDEDVNNIVNIYTNLQDRKFKAMQQLSEKVNIFKDIDYIERTRSGDKERKLGKKGVLAAVTQNFSRQIKPELQHKIIENIVTNADSGIFYPNPEHFKSYDGIHFIKYLQNKGFDKSQSLKIFKLINNTYRKLLKTPLFKKE